MKEDVAQALWITGPGAVEMRETAIDAGPGMVEVETLYSGISRGTERLVWSGGVPESEHQTMKAPFQEGEFSFPVKYGYAAVGHVSEGAGKGQVVFALHPHQTVLPCGKRPPCQCPRQCRPSARSLPPTWKPP